MTVDFSRFNRIIFFVFAVIAGLYFGSRFFIPLAFAGFLATLMRPVSVAMEKKIGIKRILSATISTLIVFLSLAGLTVLVIYQLKNFTESLPQMESELRRVLKNVQEVLSDVLGVSPQEQWQFIQERSGTISSRVEDAVQSTLQGTVNTALNFLLVMVYLFLLLLKRDRYEKFILMYLPEQDREKGKDVIRKTSEVAYHYLWGRIKVMSLLAAMYIIAFLIFDIPHAILLTVFGAIITVIPYLGPFLSGILPILVALLSGKDFTTFIIFAFVILVIQLIESYILEPVIIGSEVHLSPFAVILAIVVGGFLWGVPGMILFVPLFAIIKIISDQASPLKPIGYLLANG